MREIYLIQEESRIIRVRFTLDEQNKYIPHKDPPMIVSLGKHDNKEGIYSGAKNTIAIIRPSAPGYKKTHRFIVGDGDIQVVEYVKPEEEGDKIEFKVRHRTNEWNLTAVIAIGSDFIYALTDGFFENSKQGEGEFEKGRFHKPSLYFIDGG